MSATHLHDEVKRLSGMKMTRLFLMVFMVLAHPKEIVEDPEGEVQKQLIASANSVFDHFSSLASYRPSSSSSMSPFLTRFVQSWLTFTLAFHRFKEKDMDLVVTTLVNHAVTLAQLLKDVSEHPHANQEFQPNVMKQWKVLHQRILEVGGEKAWNQCCEVLKQHHLEEILAVEDHLNEQEKEKEKEKEKDKDNEVKQTEKKDKVNEKRLSFTFTSSTPSPSLSPTNTTSSSSFSFSESSSLTSSPSSPTFGSLQTSTTPTSSSPTPPPPAVEQLLDNHHLAHEIIMDPSFELKPASSTSTSTSDVLHHQIKSMATLAFKHRIQEAWDQHQYGFIEDLVLEIQTSLSSMTHSERVKDTLKDVLDVKRVQKQIQVGQVDIQGLLKSIVDWMLRLAAPIRDASIRSILSATSVSEAVVQIHAMLETMHLDLANYYIQQLRPYLQTRAITYETAQFAQSLKDSSSTLPNTRAWLSLSVEQWHTNYQSRNPENLPCVTPNFEDLYHDAVVQLVMNPPSIQQWPETCHLDQHRLQTFSQEVQGLLGLATYSLLVKPKSPSSSSSSSENDRQLLLDHFRTHPSTTFHTLPIPVPTTLLWTKPVHEHPVYLILTRRVHTVLKQTCTQPLPVNALPSYGLDSVTDLLQKLAHALRAFCQHNKAVHATWYDALFKDILQTTVTES
ncbi:T-complex protein 11 [Coelomomyces lativittatus]|nr:T-complex protein 11 [Coelomomyces lativittatus]